MYLLCVKKYARLCNTRMAKTEQQKGSCYHGAGFEPYSTHLGVKETAHIPTSMTMNMTSYPCHTGLVESSISVLGEVPLSHPQGPRMLNRVMRGGLWCSQHWVSLLNSAGHSPQKTKMSPEDRQLHWVLTELAQAGACITTRALPTAKMRLHPTLLLSSLCCD